MQTTHWPLRVAFVIGLPLLVGQGCPTTINIDTLNVNASADVGVTVPVTQTGSSQVDAEPSPDPQPEPAQPAEPTIPSAVSFSPQHTCNGQYVAYDVSISPLPGSIGPTLLTRDGADLFAEWIIAGNQPVSLTLEVRPYAGTFAAWRAQAEADDAKKQAIPQDSLVYDGIWLRRLYLTTNQFEAVSTIIHDGRAYIATVTYPLGLPDTSALQALSTLNTFCVLP